MQVKGFIKFINLLHLKNVWGYTHMKEKLKERKSVCGYKRLWSGGVWEEIFLIFLVKILLKDKIG